MHRIINWLKSNKIKSALTVTLGLIGWLFQSSIQAVFANVSWLNLLTLPSEKEAQKNINQSNYNNTPRGKTLSGNINSITKEFSVRIKNIGENNITFSQSDFLAEIKIIDTGNSNKELTGSINYPQNDLAPGNELTLTGIINENYVGPIKLMIGCKTLGEKLLDECKKEKEDTGIIVNTPIVKGRRIILVDRTAQPERIAKKREYYDNIELDYLKMELEKLGFIVLKTQSPGKKKEYRDGIWQSIPKRALVFGNFQNTEFSIINEVIIKTIPQLSGGATDFTYDQLKNPDGGEEYANFLDTAGDCKKRYESTGRGSICESVDFNELIKNTNGIVPLYSRQISDNETDIVIFIPTTSEEYRRKK